MLLLILIALGLVAVAAVASTALYYAVTRFRSLDRKVSKMEARPDDLQQLANEIRAKAAELDAEAQEMARKATTAQRRHLRGIGVATALAITARDQVRNRPMLTALVVLGVAAGLAWLLLFGDGNGRRPGRPEVALPPSTTAPPTVPPVEPSDEVAVSDVADEVVPDQPDTPPPVEAPSEAGEAAVPTPVEEVLQEESVPAPPRRSVQPADEPTPPAPPPPPRQEPNEPAPVEQDECLLELELALLVVEAEVCA